MLYLEEEYYMVDSSLERSLAPERQIISPGHAKSYLGIDVTDRQTRAEFNQNRQLDKLLLSQI